METLMEQKLTEKQAKMVIEFFSQQAAENAPADEGLSDTYLWKTRYQASIALDRRIGAYWWELLVEAQMDLQSFDRDPDAFMHENDIEDGKEDTRHHLETQVSWSIDNVYRNSGA